MWALIAINNIVQRGAIAIEVGILGMKSETASDGDDAFEIIRHSPPHLLITDLHLPAGGGATLIRRIRDAKSLLPIFLITDELEDAPYGVVLLDQVIILRKPVTTAQLIAACQRSGIPLGIS